MEYDTGSTIFMWLVFLPFFFLIPFNFICYVLIDVIRNKLLPPAGRRR